MPTKTFFNPRGENRHAEAQRNRDRILEVAKQAVGPVTLYRGLPTRDALLEGVGHNEVEKLKAAERELSPRLPPLEPCTTLLHHSPR